MFYFDLLVFLFFSSCKIGFQNQIQFVGTNYGGMVAFRMAEMYPNFVKKVVQGRSQYSQVEESGKLCADLWRNPWKIAAGLAMWVPEFQSRYLE
jgi:pimeloyl-ACP methyl ester carboxylesterase